MGMEVRWGVEQNVTGCELVQISGEGVAPSVWIFDAYNIVPPLNFNL